MSKRPVKADPDMKSEYDFSSATRGKFYRKDAVLVPPIHLEPDVLTYLQARAAAKGTSLQAARCREPGVSRSPLGHRCFRKLGASRFG